MERQQTAQTTSAPPQRSSTPAVQPVPPQSTSLPAFLEMQQTLGNQAVQRLYRSGVLQAKLKIGAPGDKYEQEADRVADTVMRMPEPIVRRQAAEEEEPVQAKPLAAQITPLVQRQPATEEEEPMQAKFESGGEVTIQRQAWLIAHMPVVQRAVPVAVREDDDKKKVQTKSLLQRQEENEDESAQTKTLLQRQEEKEDEKPAQAKHVDGLATTLQRQEEKEDEAQTFSLQRQKEEDESAQARYVSTAGPQVQRQEEKEEESAQTKTLLQRQENKEEEKPAQAKSVNGLAASLQRQEEKEEETQTFSLQRQKEDDESAQAKLASTAGPQVQRQEEKEEESAQTKTLLQRQENKEEEKPAQAKSVNGLAASLQRQEEKEDEAQTFSLQRQKEEDESAQAKLASNAGPQLQRQEEKEDEAAQTKSLLQRQEKKEKEEPAQARFVAGLSSALQRQEEKEDESAQAMNVQRRQMHISPPALRAKPGGNGEMHASSAVEARVSHSRGGGSALPHDTRAFMEPRFGVDFSQVRVHTGTDAAQMSQDLNAQAFTVGRDIYFGNGKYNPQTSGGQHLLAHELTHTIQQGTAVQHKPQPVSRGPHQIQRKKKPSSQKGSTKESTSPQKDAFAGKSYDLNKKEGGLQFAADWHTQLLWEHLAYLTEGADLQKKLLTGRTFFIYTMYYWPKLKEMAEKLPPVAVVKEVGKAVEDAHKDAETEKNSALRIPPEDYRTLFPETHAREYEEEARKLREEAKKGHDVREKYKLESVGNKKEFLEWGEYEYYEELTATLHEAEAKRIRNGEWSSLTFDDHKLFFVFKGRDQARLKAEQEYDAYVKRATDPMGTWEQAHLKQFEADLNKQAAEPLRDLLGVEIYASQIRIKAGEDVLPSELLEAWAAADLAMKAMMPTLQKGVAPPPGHATIPIEISKETKLVVTGKDAAIATLKSFCTKFRAHVSKYDVTETRTVFRGGPAAYMYTYKIVSNPYFEQSKFNYIIGKIEEASSAGDWKLVFKEYNSIVTGLDRYIAAELEKKGRKEEGEQLKAAGMMAGELSNLLLEHPETQKARAMFYPEGELENVGSPGTPNFRALGIPLFFYLYRQDGTWYLVDVTTPHQVKVTNESGGTSQSPPYALFAELNTKLRFPKGRLYWSLSDSSAFTLQTTGEMRVSEWLTWIGVSLGILAAAIALTVWSFGLAMPAVVWVLSIGAGVMGALGGVADIAEKSQAGVLTSQDIMIDTLSVVANIFSAASLGLGKLVVSGALKTGTMAKLAILADRLYVPVTLAAMGADVASFAVFAAGAFESLNEIDKMPGSDKDREMAKARLFGQLLLMSTITLLSIKGSLPGIMKGRNLFLDIDPNGQVVARPFLTNEELLKAATRLQEPQNVIDLLGRQDLPEDLLNRIRAGVSQALSIGPVGSKKLEELITRLKVATKPDEVNAILAELTSRSRIGAHMGAGAASNLTMAEIRNLNLLDDQTLKSLKDARPSDIRNIAGLSGSDPKKAAELMNTYSSQLFEHLRYNPVSSLDELESALKKASIEVKQTVGGLWESISLDQPPKGWKFKTQNGVITEKDGTRVVTIAIEGPTGAKGLFTRSYNPNSGALEMREAFLILPGAKKGLPSIITEVKIPMVPAKGGTPAIHYLNLYQMKMLGVPFAGQVGLSKVKMSTIQNVEAIIHLHWLRQRFPNLSLDELISHTSAVNYAENSLIQAGYQRIGNARLIKGTNIEEGPIKKLLAFVEKGQPVRINQHAELLKKYGFDRNTRMIWNFDIEFDVGSIPRSIP